MTLSYIVQVMLAIEKNKNKIKSNNNYFGKNFSHGW